MVDTTDRLSHMELRVKVYLEARYPKGYSIEAQVNLSPCHLRFEVRDADGQAGPTLILSGDFADYGDGVERELDARDVMGAMASAGRGNVIVPKVGSPVVEPAR